MTALRRIQPYFIENRATILAGVFFLIVVDFLQLIIPRIVKNVVDDLAALSIDASGLLAHAGRLVLLAVLIGIFRYVWRRCLIGTSRKVEAGLRNELFAHIQTLSTGYFQRVKTGDIMAHATNDIQQVRMATGMGMVALTDAVVLGTAAVGFMAYINPQLTALVLIPMPLIVVGTRLLGRRMHRSYRDVQEAFSDLTETVREQLAGIRIIKGHGMEAAAAGRTRDGSKAYILKNLRLARIVGAFFPLMLFFTNLSLAAVLYFGGRQTVTGVISPGDFVAFISYLGLLTWPMMALGWVTNLIQRGRASLERLDRILNTAPEIVDRPGARPVPGGAPAIDIENVSLVYPPGPDEATGGREALHDIHLNIPAGSVLGVVGPPGSGKSTLLSLLPRVLDVTAGEVRLNGTDLRLLQLDGLRRQAAYVPQEPFLFSDTVGTNIAIGAPQADPQALMLAVSRSALSETIRGLEDGFDTRVGEKGIVLSGGQKQRVALARALLTDADLLVLDDPVSQLDADTAGVVIDTIRAEAGRRTIVIASHRLAAVRFADRIVALKDGRIMESGTHAELVASGGFYARTFQLQRLEESLNAG